ncbi:hypothetical protein KQI85_07015 [Falcatimonas sp. MSJ-15]|uniref:BRO-N domain-containing protein n=1 Tax=Falcatimonas sp. MSJ-15 TaxID=2841515 RepID=UPI001C0FFE69|nr:BRO family protein [Falcatimonas sp. MSJ-15]MBU5470117.1 hypothetical protein [Falcatimonas sp. MSJ-15]
MNNLQIFKSTEFGTIRTVMTNNEPWFVGKDVATVLGYERATKAIRDHVDEDDVDEIPIQDSIGRMQNTPIINESGLYSLILGSKLPSAKRFKHWVTSEVLPSIRKTGHYEMSGYTPKATSLGEVVNLIKVTRETMKAQKASPTEIATAVKKICEQFGVELPECFIKPERMTMADAMDMVDFIYSQPKGKKQPTYEDYIIYRANKKRLNG